MLQPARSGLPESYFILPLRKLNKNCLRTLSFVSHAHEEKKTFLSLFFFVVLFYFFLNTTQMTSKFSGTVAGFNDILQILVNISAASHFHFLRNTRLSTICSW